MSTSTYQDSMSSESDIKPIQRTNSGHVIVFDPATQTLTTEKAKKLKDYDAKLQTAPKLGSRVDIFVDSRLVATINLSKLSWAANTKRFFGKCNQILVMELPDGILPPRIKAS